MPEIAHVRIRRRFAACVLGVLLTAGVAAPGPAAATAPCSDPDWYNRWDGAFTAYSPVYSVRGSMVDRTVALCSNVAYATSGSTSWLMVAGGGTYEYAQIGYIKFAGQLTSRFVEYNDGESGAGWARLYYSGYSTGSNHFYEVLFDFVNQPRKFSLRVDGVTKAVTPWSPEGGEWSVGWTGQYSGETFDAGDDVPGTSALKTNFTNIKAISCWQCGWGDPPQIFLHSDLPAAYRNAWVTPPRYFDIWTQR